MIVAESAAEDKIIKALRAMLADGAWADLSLGTLARKAKLPLAAFYALVPTKSALLTLLLRRADLAVLSTERQFAADDVPRDRLFDIMMSRLESLLPDREILRGVMKGMPGAAADMALCAPALMRSMVWMLDAAGLQSNAVAVGALGVVHLNALRVFLGDEDPGLAKTMAALDRGLRRVESLWRLASPPHTSPEPPPTKKKRKRKA